MAKPVFKSTAKKAPVPSAKYDAGSFIFEEGDLGTEMYILQEGEVEVLQQFDGKEEILAVLEKGDFLGEMSILEDLPRTASARARTDITVICINGTTFDQMLKSRPEIAVRIMRKLSRRLRQTDQLLREALGNRKSQSSEIPLPAAPKDRELASQLLVSEATGAQFNLAAVGDTLVGRRDPVTGINPDIDLTTADTQRSTSRRHAKIVAKDGKFFVCEEIGTMNGTFVNGERVPTGVLMEFTEGDEVQFGLVKLQFRGK
ncbi:MAG: cyclic nucleotide-binding domain-containing protein [Thermoanaerobaculia bacterium]|nr:cyclic nucleotide-binding domain-containing protein [Thermoanaerobaculia bacterium]